MQNPILATEILALEEELIHYQTLLDTAFSANAQFSETKIIFHELKKISDKLKAIKLIALQP